MAFTKDIIDYSTALRAATILADCTKDHATLTFTDLADKLGFLTTIDEEVAENIRLRPMIKDVPRKPETVKESLVNERKNFLSLAMSLGAFDDLVKDEHGNSVRFESRLGIKGGVGRLGEAPPPAAKPLPGEKRAKDPNAKPSWTRVKEEFVARLGVVLAEMCADGKSHSALDVAKAMGATLETVDEYRRQIQACWTSHPMLSENGRQLYKTKQGAGGGVQLNPVEAEETVSSDEDTSLSTESETSDESDSDPAGESEETVTQSE